MMKQQLNKAPLCFTLVQLRFNPVTNLANYISKIQDRFRRMKFDTFTEDPMQQQLIVDSGGLQIRVVPTYAMGDFEGRRKFVLGTETLVFQTSDYSVYSHFKDVFLEGVRIIHEELELSTSLRLGLRYVNAISDTEAEDTMACVDPSILGFAIGDTMRDYTYGESRAMRGDNHLLIKTLVRDGIFVLPGDLQAAAMPMAAQFTDLGGFHIVLDIDAFDDKPTAFDLQAIGSKLDELHETAEVAFESATTDQARKAWV